MTGPAGFGGLIPEVIIGAVESALGRPFTGLAMPLPSYINRVYELQARDGERIIAKFYRPGRWTPDALADEQRFVADCARAEIPVVPPLDLPGRGTLHEADGYRFSLFPKRGGRALELNALSDYLRIGRLLGRLHVVGARDTADHRVVLHPDHSLADDIDYLIDGEWVDEDLEPEFEDIADALLDAVAERFDGTEFIRVHGDCHVGNILDRPGEGLMLIDFDDMAMGPPGQDLWLLLPDRASRCPRELEALLRGYQEFREFDRSSLRLIEPLRAMRMIYFLAWQARQSDDYRFQTAHPDWGSRSFWRQEIADLREQLQVIGEE